MLHQGGQIRHSQWEVPKAAGFIKSEDVVGAPADKVGDGTCGQNRPFHHLWRPCAKEGIQLVSTRDPMKVAHPNNPHSVCMCMPFKLCLWVYSCQKDPNTMEKPPLPRETLISLEGCCQAEVSSSGERFPLSPSLSC